MKQFQFRKLASSDKNTRLVVVTGKYKNRRIAFDYTSGSKITGTLLNPKNLTEREYEGQIEVAYANVEFIDSEGEPMIVPVTDMTGREIRIDSIVCYSVNTSHSHALEIGRVKAISNSGTISVKCLRHNGERVGNNRWDTTERRINDPDRSLRLPADDATVMMWIMKDFDDIEEFAV